jgi:hypothetical protein
MQFLKYCSCWPPGGSACYPLKTFLISPSYAIFLNIAGAGRQVALDDQLRQDFAYKVTNSIKIIVLLVN